MSPVPHVFELKRLLAQEPGRHMPPENVIPASDTAHLLAASVYVFRGSELDAIPEAVYGSVLPELRLPEPQCWLETRLDTRLSGGIETSAIYAWECHQGHIHGLLWMRRARVWSKPALETRLTPARRSQDCEWQHTAVAEWYADMSEARGEMVLRDMGGSVAAVLARGYVVLNAREGAQVTKRVVPLDKRRKGLRAGVSGWEYRVISVRDGARLVASAPRGGTHASPRWHVRRGHLRRLRSGREVWVNACEVGAKDRGGVVKDYAVGAAVDGC